MYIKFNVEKLKELSLKKLQANPDYLKFLELKKHKEEMLLDLEYKKSELEIRLHQLEEKELERKVFELKQNGSNTDLINAYAKQIEEIQKFIETLNKKTIIGNVDEYDFGLELNNFLSWEVTLEEANEFYITTGMFHLFCDKKYWEDIKNNAEAIGIPQLKDEDFIEIIAKFIENMAVYKLFSKYPKLKSELGFELYIKALEKVFFIATLPPNFYKNLNSDYLRVDEFCGGDILDAIENSYNRKYGKEISQKILESFMNDKFYKENDIDLAYPALCVIINPEALLERNNDQITIRPGKKVIGSISKELAKKGIYTGMEWFTFADIDKDTTNAIYRIGLDYKITDEEIDKLLDDDEAYRLNSEEPESFGM